MHAKMPDSNMPLAVVHDQLGHSWIEGPRCLSGAGLKALSDNVPGEANEAAEIGVASCVMETTVVGTGLPFTYTVAALEEGPPVRVMVVVPNPA